MFKENRLQKRDPIIFLINPMSPKQHSDSRIRMFSNDLQKLYEYELYLCGDRSRAVWISVLIVALLRTPYLPERCCPTR